ncbi:hypothetical protein [Paeniglutamicibacter sp.]|uniref:hypothetical protein n=1 Tax=Paeniglutamicibacter sp. TaxID=1934391 RepID=UPI00398A00D1
MGALDPDKYQELLNARDELDDVPVSITRHQAQKCAAIITAGQAGQAGQAGHTAYAEATDVVTCRPWPWRCCRERPGSPPAVPRCGGSSRTCRGRHRAHRVTNYPEPDQLRRQQESTSGS